MYTVRRNTVSHALPPTSEASGVLSAQGERRGGGGEGGEGGEELLDPKDVSPSAPSSPEGGDFAETHTVTTHS